MDGRQHSSRPEHVQEGEYADCPHDRETCSGATSERASRTNADTKTMQMWVEKDEWQENPDIIHTKFA